MTMFGDIVPLKKVDFAGFTRSLLQLFRPRLEAALHISDYRIPHIDFQLKLVFKR